MPRETHIWIPASTEPATLESRWHYLRGWLDRLRVSENISLKSPLGIEIDRACRKDTPAAKSLSRITAYLRGHGLDTVEALEGWDVSHTMLILAMTHNPRLAPLTESLWQTCRQMVEEKDTSSERRFDDTPEVPVSVKRLLNAIQSAVRSTSPSPEHRAQLSRLHAMCQDALDWPPAAMVPLSSVTAPAGDEMLQDYAFRLLLDTGGFATTAAIDEGIDRACALRQKMSPPGMSSPKTDMALSLLTDIDSAHHSHALLCLWGWRWLQQNPEFASTELLEKIDRRISRIPTETLESLGLTEGEAITMTQSSIGPLRTLGWLAASRLPVEADAEVIAPPVSRPTPSTEAPLPRPRRPS